MFSFIFNVLLSIVYGFHSIIMTLITGKLCKISTYHHYHNSHDANPFEVCSDNFIKTQLPQNVSASCRVQIISEFLNTSLDNNTDIKRMESKLSDYILGFRAAHFKEN